MGIRCICQYCVCGRHRCPHQRSTIGNDMGGSDVPCKLSEYQQKYIGSYDVSRPKPIIHSDNDIGGKGPMNTATEYRTIYKRHPVEPFAAAKNTYGNRDPLLQAGKDISGATLYKDEYTWKEGQTGKNYAPVREYKRPSKTMLKSSGYQDAYGGFTADERARARPGVISHKPNLSISNTALDTTTTSGAAYVRYPNVVPRKPYKPVLRTCPPAKFDGNTNYHSEYTPKSVSRPEQVRPKGQIVMDGDMAIGNSTQRDDYTYKYQPIRSSFKPDQQYVRRDIPFAKSTVHKDEFVKWPLQHADIPEWAKPKSYAEPNVPFAKDTLYKSEYGTPSMDARRQPIIHQAQGVLLPEENTKTPGTQYNDEFGRRHDGFVKPDSFKKVQQFEPPTIPMALATSYRSTFKGQRGEKAKPCPPLKKIGLGRVPFHRNTIYKMEYLPKNVECPAKELDDAVKSGDPQRLETLPYKSRGLRDGHFMFEKGSLEALKVQQNTVAKPPSAKDKMPLSCDHVTASIDNKLNTLPVV